VRRCTKPVARTGVRLSRERVRCFLAVPLRDPALGAAQRTLAQLRENVDAVRWTRPETLHITVHFFGNVDDADVANAVDAVTPVVGDTPPFELTLDALGAFPERGSPRVLWLGASAVSNEMTELAMRCREALDRAGFEVDARPFRAHCTLGRPRMPWPIESRAAWRDMSTHPIESNAFTADALVMYESVPSRGGAIYTQRVLLRLGG